jgi:hypothetical protein
MDTTGNPGNTYGLKVSTGNPFGKSNTAEFTRIFIFGEMNSQLKY